MKVDDQDFRGLSYSVIEFAYQVQTILNNGKYQQSIVSTAPTWTPNNGETNILSTATVQRLYYYLSGWKFIDLTTPKVWINFSGTATPSAKINQSYNVSTITRVSIGYYSINFSNNVTNANLVPSGMARDLSNNALLISPFVGTTS